MLLSVSSDDYTRLTWGWKTANVDYSHEKKNETESIMVFVGEINL